MTWCHKVSWLIRSEVESSEYVVSHTLASVSTCFLSNHLWSDLTVWKYASTYTAPVCKFHVLLFLSSGGSTASTVHTLVENQRRGVNIDIWRIKTAQMTSIFCSTSGNLDVVVSIHYCQGPAVSVCWVFRCFLFHDKVFWYLNPSSNLLQVCVIASPP